LKGREHHENLNQKEQRMRGATARGTAPKRVEKGSYALGDRRRSEKQPPKKEKNEGKREEKPKIRRVKKRP